MNDPYAIDDTSRIFSPGLVFFADLIRGNIAKMIEMAGGAHRLRPHVKTHKSPDVSKLAMQAGITKHKCATLGEAEMLGRCGAADVLLAYPMVGPNCARFAKLVQAYPSTRFSCLFDHPTGLEGLSAAAKQAGIVADAMIDLDVGQHRTGIAPGPEAAELYAMAARLPGLRPAGLHVYDGHNHQESIEERQQAAKALLAPALALRDRLVAEGLPVDRIVAGGTPTFPAFARMTDVPGLECSPGTLVLHDNGYGSRFADLAGFVPAALILTRVISRPTPTRVTFDLGYKAVASDPPAGKRLKLLGLPPHETLLQNEEHLVIETTEASRFKPGDEALAIPQHICPTVAMHQRAYVIEGGKLVGTWDISGRDRFLSV